MDVILVLVLCLLLYSISARDPLAPPGLFDWLQLVLVVAALAVDAVTLTAMLTRIAEFGFSPNKVAALGLNLVLLVHLAGRPGSSVGFLRGRAPVRPDRAVADAVPARSTPCGRGVVVVIFPPVFAFA